MGVGKKNAKFLCHLRVCPRSSWNLFAFCALSHCESGVGVQPKKVVKAAKPDFRRAVQILDLLEMVVGDVRTYQQPPREVARVVADIVGDGTSTSIFNDLPVFSSMASRQKVLFQKSEGALELTVALWCA